VAGVRVSIEKEGRGLGGFMHVERENGGGERHCV
jgi:hypothetical protein